MPGRRSPKGNRKKSPKTPRGAAKLKKLGKTVGKSATAVRRNSSSKERERRRSSGRGNGGGMHKDAGKLIMAVKRDDWQDAKKLLAKNAMTAKELVNSVDRKGVTPLIHCVLHNSKGTIKVILGTGADANRQDRDGNTALHMACKHEYTHLLKLLMRFGANPKVKNNAGKQCHQLSKRSLQLSRLIQQSLEQRNNPPEIKKFIPELTAHIGAPFSFTFDEDTFIDADGDVLSYSAYGMPTSVVFNPQKRMFFGVPSLSDCKGHKDYGDDYMWARKFEVTVYAADAYSMAAQTFKLCIYATGEVVAPYVQKPLVDCAAKVGADFNYEIPEGTFSQTGLEYTAQGMPPSIKFDPQTKTFSGVPTPGEAQITSIDDDEEREEERKREANLRRIGELSRSAAVVAEAAKLDQEELTKTVIYLQRWYRGYLQRKRLREMINLAHMHLKGVIDYVYTISVVGSVPNKEYCSCSTTFDLRVFWEDAKSEKERLAREENLKKEKESNMTDFQRRKRLERANTEEEVKARKARVEEKRRAKNADSKTAEDGQEDAVECENCEEHVADVYCRECDMSLCFSNNCDDDFHKPVKMRKHRRVLLKEHALSQNAKATMSYEKYAEGGKEIKRYECEDDFGFFYVYKNHSPRLQLEEILEFSELKNLVLKGKGLAEQAKIRVYVPPNGSAEVHFKKLQPRDACSVQVLQHISVTPGGKGKHSSVSPAAALADLKERALKEGEAEDYDDVKEGVGKEIVRYSYKHTEGYCFLYVNKNAKYQLIEQLEFEMKNLQIHGEEPDVRQIKITVPPGQEQFVELVTVARKKGFSLEVSSATRLKKCKSKW